MKILGYIANIFLDVLFPRACVGCGKIIRDKQIFICGACEKNIRPETALACPQCGKRLPEKRLTCHPMAGFMLGSAERYGNETLTELVKILKYKKLETAAIPLGSLLGKFVETAGVNLQKYEIIPIPLAPKRLRERGFNQAELIAKEMLKCLSLPENKLSLNILERSRHTEPQVTMASFEERAKNVAGCFSVLNPDAVKGGSFALVDDVFTSGSTIKEAVTILKNAGAKKIIALTILRV